MIALPLAGQKGRSSPFSTGVPANGTFRETSRRATEGSGSGKCLSFTVHSFPLTDDWSAVSCERGDAGFSYVYSPARQPRLGATWRHLPGFGQIQPVVISFGGDPTSVVVHVHWTNWGSAEAIGIGESDWVWPGTCVGCNRATSVRVVAFHLGTCHGHPSYNAFEWYFPQYGETFKPGDYTNSCTHGGATREPPPATITCPDTSLAGGASATNLTVAGVTCESADNLIAQIPEGPFYTEQRLEIAGFRCGTQGVFSPPPITEVWACEVPGQSVSFIASH